VLDVKSLPCCFDTKHTVPATRHSSSRPHIYIVLVSLGRLSVSRCRNSECLFWQSSSDVGCTQSTQLCVSYLHICWERTASSPLIRFWRWRHRIERWFNQPTNVLFCSLIQMCSLILKYIVELTRFTRLSDKPTDAFHGPFQGRNQPYLYSPVMSKMLSHITSWKVWIPLNFFSMPR